MNPHVLKLRVGMGIHPVTGRAEPGSGNQAASELFALADRGSRLHLVNKAYAFRVATYACRFNEAYLHSYTYASEQAWVAYEENLAGQDWRQEDFLFPNRCFFRVLLTRTDGKNITAGEVKDTGKILLFSPGEQQVPWNPVFLPEIGKTCSRVKALREDGSLVFAVLADTHVTVNGTWEGTVGNLKELHGRIGFDAVIHLGDLTDGIVPRHITYHYIHEMLEDLRQIGAPVHVVLGNHDANYFQKNPDVFSLKEQAALFLSGSPGVRPYADCPYRYCDYPEHGLRCIFLSAYRNEEKLRYGYDMEQLAWLADTMEKTQEGMRVLIFSHDAPIARLDFWSDEIRNEAEIMKILGAWQEQRHDILGFIHGHTHADFVCRERGIPIISVGCAKCEDMQEKKPEGSHTEPRQMGTVTQELWDVLVIQPQKGTLDFVRFGAGQDRHVFLDEALP